MHVLRILYLKCEDTVGAIEYEIHLKPRASPPEIQTIVFVRIGDPCPKMLLYQSFQGMSLYFLGPVEGAPGPERAVNPGIK
jgi:hypothetical protein